jgi:ATP-dependent Clp protease adaptor protein ClpS
VTSAPVRAPARRPSARRPGEGLGDRWKVIVLNDDHNTFEGVAFALASTLPGVSYERGLKIADRIHHAGSDVVWSGLREPAELYWQRLNEFGLTMAPLEA